MRELLARLAAELAAHGIHDWLVERGGKHLHLKFSLDGRQLMLVLPCTPSDWRSAANSLADLRRLIRSRVPALAKEQRQPTSRNRRYRPPQQRVVPALTSFSVRSDPFEQLRPLLSRITATAET